MRSAKAPPYPRDLVGRVRDVMQTVIFLEASNASIIASRMGMSLRTLADAENRTPTARADIKVLSAEAVTWPDGSLGCPQPGMMYTQALVPGFRIVLQAADRTLVVILTDAAHMPQTTLRNAVAYEDWIAEVLEGRDRTTFGRWP